MCQQRNRSASRSNSAALYGNTFLILAFAFGFCAWGCAESEREPAAVAPGPATLEQRLARYDLPELPDSIPRKNDTLPKRAELPGPVTLAPKRPEMLFRASAAFPDFASIEDAGERKRRFFAFLRPLVLAENTWMREQRLHILRLFDAFQMDGDLSELDREWLKGMCEEYRVPPADLPSEEMFRKLLLRVDVVPLELALAQAATESAWGRSRFAREGNNIFGEWCFKEGCGIVPKRRPKGATYEVATFRSPSHSIRSYIGNLNSHPAYRQFRVLRYDRRLNGERPDGHTLALGLKKYSGIGMEYVDRLRVLMRQNRDLISGR